MAYSTDADLEFRRPDILGLGTDSFTEYHDAAKEMIDRYLDVNWYRQNAVERGADPAVDLFDPTLIQDDTTLKDASTYLTLSIIYESMRKNLIEDGFTSLMEKYREDYDREIELIINVGIDYDWTPVEAQVKRQPRTLHRG